MGKNMKEILSDDLCDLMQKYSIISKQEQIDFWDTINLIAKEERTLQDECY